MATVELAYVNGYRDRHGKQRYYYRRAGRRIALPGRPGEPEFMRAYEDAAAKFGQPDEPATKTAPGTFDALSATYYRSPQFLSLSVQSQRTYRFAIDRWRKNHGAKRVTHLERRHVLEHLAVRFDNGGPEAANQLRKVLKILCRFAMDNDWRRDDPTVGVRRYKPKGEGFIPWSEDDIAKFLKRWGAGSRERLALCLLLFLGQRRGDTVRMGRQHRNGDTIRVTQSKTGTQLTIALHPELRAVLDKLPNDNLTYLTTMFGKPFTPAGFGNWFRDVCNAAGLKDRSAHGLRKSAARRLAEAGCTTKQIAAITGHKSLSEVERYTASADQERMAREAIKRLILAGAG
jgi:integrase